MQPRPGFSRHFGLALALACWIPLSLLAGCASEGLRGPGWKNNELGELGRRLRAEKSTRGAWGFSSKARDIERDLGVD